MKMLYLAVILLMLSGVLTQVSDWGVKYPDNPICAMRGFSVSIPCIYYYPTSKHSIQFSYSGEYKFRFITNKTGGRWVGEPGAILQVGDLKVSLIRLSGNGTFKHGDSLNLMCDVNCTQNSSQFLWSKNNEQLNISGPVLHFPAVTMRDSGNYTCTWKTNASRSETISLHVEGDDTENPENLENPDGWPIWMIASLTVGVSVIVSVILGAVIYNWSVFTEQQKKDDSDIYANDQQKTDYSHIYANAQQKKDDFDIYANI